MIIWKHKEEYHHLATKLFNAEPVSAITFLAIGEFTRRATKQTYPFSIKGHTRGHGLWDYTYHCWLRFTSSEMQRIRQAAKNLPADEIIHVPGSTPSESRTYLDALLRSRMTRIYPLREAEKARSLGAIFDPQVKGWYLPRHIAAEPFSQWLSKPSIDTPPYYSTFTTGSAETVILANPEELAPHSILRTTINNSSTLIGINNVGKTFTTSDGPRAYHHFEVIE